MVQTIEHIKNRTEKLRLQKNKSTIKRPASAGFLLTFSYFMRRFIKFKLEFIMKEKLSDLFIVLFSGFIVLSIMYFCTNILVALINQHVALSSEYQYAKFATFSVDKASIYFTLPFLLVYLFLFMQTVFHCINNVDLKRKTYFTLFSVLPLLMIAFQYKSTDEFMYQPISSLYDETVKLNPSFAKSPIGIKFSKALISHDYDTLKEFSNDLDALKIIDLKNNKILEVVNLFPLKSVDTFNQSLTSTQGHLSLADYKKFYAILLTDFKSSEIAGKKEFVYLIGLIDPAKLKL